LREGKIGVHEGEEVSRRGRKDWGARLAGLI